MIAGMTYSKGKIGRRGEGRHRNLRVPGYIYTHFGEMQIVCNHRGINRPGRCCNDSIRYRYSRSLYCAGIHRNLCSQRDKIQLWVLDLQYPESGCGRIGFSGVDIFQLKNRSSEIPVCVFPVMDFHNKDYHDIHFYCQNYTVTTHSVWVNRCICEPF